MAKKRTARIALALALIALWISALAIPVNAQSTGGQTVVEYSQLGDMTLSFEQPGDTYTLQIINDTQQPVALTGMDIPSQFDKYFQPLTLTWPQNLEPQQAFEIALVQTQKPVTRTAPIELVLHKQSGGQATIYLQMCSCHLVNEGLETTRVEIPAEDYDATSMLTLQADVRLEGDCIIDGHANQSIALRVCLAEQKEEPIEVQNAPDQPQTCYIQ